MSGEVRDFRTHGETEQEETEELVEYVGESPSGQVRILLRDGTGYTDERRRWYLNSVYGGPLIDRPLDLNDNFSPYDEEGRANFAPITKKEFEAAWVRSFEFLSERVPGPGGWSLPEK